MINFGSGAVFAKERNMTRMDDHFHIARKGILVFHSQLTLQNRELFALEMESLTSEMKRMKLKEQVVALLHFFGMRCTVLKD